MLASSPTGTRGEVRVRTCDQLRLWFIGREAEQARLEALPEEVLEERTAEALSTASGLLLAAASALDTELRDHGWTEEFARNLANHLAEFRDAIRAGTYRIGDRYPLGRWVQEYISPKTSDWLKDAVYNANDLLEAWDHRQPKATRFLEAAHWWRAHEHRVSVSAQRPAVRRSTGNQDHSHRSSIEIPSVRDYIDAVGQEADSIQRLSPDLLMASIDSS